MSLNKSPPPHPNGTMRTETTKRPLGNDHSSPAPKRFKPVVSHDVAPRRNSVAVLNELRSGLAYVVKSQCGPPHAPVFNMEVTVDGHVYTGTGRSKKLAKLDAAENALKSFIQFPSNCKMVANVSSDSNGMDFTNDIDTSGCERSGSQTSLNSSGRRNSNGKGNGKTAVMIVNELYTGTKYVTAETDNMYAKFKVIATIEGQDFLGTGANKKAAKLAACTAALTKLLAAPGTGGPNANLIEKRDGQNVADQIGRLVNDTFLSVMRTQPMYARRKVLAGIVMQRPGRPLHVIAATTGTKCISGEHISINGRVLNDMHAEILARRVLVHYLYSQMELLVGGGEGSNESIFEPTPLHAPDQFQSPSISSGRTSNNTHESFDKSQTTAQNFPRLIPETQKNPPEHTYPFRLKEGIQFHLYINTAPCGDARIFSPHEDVCQTGVDNHPNRASRGQLRTKIESGEGTVPIKGEIVQTWDGVLVGARLLTMSCSDKIARWNVLGIQGALLSSLIPPIYLGSVVLASLFHERHLYRALCGRIESTLQALPPPYMLNRPQLNAVTSCENRQPTKAPNYSVNWMCHEPTVEVVNTTTGRPDLVANGPELSRLCKHAFYKRFLDMMAKLPKATLDVVQANFDYSTDGCYADVKQSVLIYQTAKMRLHEAFAKAKLGIWVKKPMEQDQFIMD